MNEIPGEVNKVEKVRILFVDDEPNFLAGLRRMLRAYRDTWDVEFAGGVDEALSLCAKNEYDTIVSDVNMPEKTGFDLLAELKENEKTKDIPVIILTGNAENDLKRRALDCGATDLLNKPVSLEDLTARLRNATKLKAYEDMLRNQNLILEGKVRERTVALERSRMDIIWRLAKAGEFRDEDTGEHVLRVAACSRELARKMGCEPTFVDAIFVTSPLHDIGKIGVPDGILLKPGKLTSEEHRIMQDHCEIGAAILTEQPRGMEYFGDTHTEAVEAVEALKDNDSGLNLHQIAAEIALSHHEKWDGSGYPMGLAGTDIPLGGQIVAVADVYDALRSERAYKPAYGVEETLGKMRPGKGNHFAPRTFEAFEQCVDVFEEIRCDLRDTASTMVDHDEASSFR
jgi:putative two-component system response regulator